MRTDILNRENRKTEELSLEEAKKLSVWVDKQPTFTDAAAILDMQPNTLTRIIALKRGAPNSIKKIRAAIAA